MKIKKALILASLFSVIWPQIAFAAFSDVPASNPDYAAINYLQETGILMGYSDGTFRPDQPVNRAEFLKIILEGSQIDTTTATTSLPFTDIDQNAWYTPYVRTAFSLGVIEGYSDGTFRPAQTINKAETLKILAKVQNWPVKTFITVQPFDDVYKTAWFTPYVDYAKEQNYLAETGTLFLPENLMTRANISTVIYRTFDDVSIPVQDETPTPPSDNSDYEEISASYFDGISLDESLPSIFYKNEIYQIAGRVTSQSFDSMTVILKNNSTQQTSYFRANLDGQNFTIQIPFGASGDFSLGIIAGETGQSRIADITVESSLPQIPDSTSTLTKISSSIKYADDQTYLQLSDSPKTIKKITFTQNSRTVNYLSRQNIDQIQIQYPDFKNFSEGKVSYTLSAATLSTTKPLALSSSFENMDSDDFQAVEHSFDEILDSEISANPPDTVAENRDISFTGKVLTDSDLTALVITPDGNVEEVDLETSSPTGTYNGAPIIKSGGNFTFSYDPPETGRYIVEINSQEGTPTLNHPVYIGDKFPLIPDYFDLNERALFSGTLNINDARNEFLNYINQGRTEAGLSTLALDTDLNNIAQEHATDMASNNYFAHDDLNGASPEDRRLAADIPTPVYENIAKDVSVPFAHYGLMRSASHRQNILTPEWTRVGLGISAKNGYLYLDQEFSYNPLTASDLTNFKNDLFTEINQARTADGKPALSKSDSADSASKDLNDKSINTGLSITNGDLTNALSTYDITGSSLGLFRNHPLWSKIVDSIITDTDILSTWQNIGIDVALDNMDYLQVMIILNSN
ncbi:MAG: S-layer homology domain-containing protein [Candidatus Gracilibacteria bacterium]